MNQLVNPREIKTNWYPKWRHVWKENPSLLVSMLNFGGVIGFPSLTKNSLWFPSLKQNRLPETNSKKNCQVPKRKLHLPGTHFQVANLLFSFKEGSDLFTHLSYEKNLERTFHPKNAGCFKKKKTLLMSWFLAIPTWVFPKMVVPPNHPT